MSSQSADSHRDGTHAVRLQDASWSTCSHASDLDFEDWWREGCGPWCGDRWWRADALTASISLSQRRLRRRRRELRGSMIGTGSMCVCSGGFLPREDAGPLRERIHQIEAMPGHIDGVRSGGTRRARAGMRVSLVLVTAIEPRVSGRLCRLCALVCVGSPPPVIYRLK